MAAIWHNNPVTTALNYNKESQQPLDDPKIIGVEKVAQSCPCLRFRIKHNSATIKNLGQCLLQ